MSIFNHFKHLNLSEGQKMALTKLEEFLESPVQLFILKGYAGSGKTTILKGLVEYLIDIEKEYALMAPTGRAAKVISDKTRQEAFTIHKSIYSYEDLIEVEDGDSFYYSYKIRNSVDVVEKVFIIDEASMLSDAKSVGEFFQFGTGHLLTDLITYTRIKHPNVKSKIIFVGDPCQLAPVGDTSSKAFDQNYLKEKFNISIDEIEMKEVKRQAHESAILNAASKIRKSISAGYFNDFNLQPNTKDIFNPSFENFLDLWQDTPNPKIIIASKNKTCHDLNLQIRKRRFGNSDLPIQQSDIIIIGSNNYRKGIFNGEFAVVNQVGEIDTRIIPLRGKSPVTLNWRDIELVFPDSEVENKIVRGKILENFLQGDNDLNPEEMQALYVDFTTRHPNLKPRTEEFKEAIMQDEYFNCLMIKFGYAITCHKAQGGEWENVFTIWDNDNLEGFNCYKDTQRRAGKTNQSFYRWAYTAITRASKKLYALNPPNFNSYSSLAFLDESVINSLNELSASTIQTEDISLDHDLLSQLSEFKLLDLPLQFQDHFIKVRHAVRSQYIEINGWERIGYEIRYSFVREKEKAVFRTYVNGQNEFKKPFTSMLNFSPYPQFNNSLDGILNHLPNISIKRNTVETIQSKIDFDIDLEEKLPFLRSLLDDLSLKLNQLGISIVDVEHKQFKERYKFQRNSETAVVDFEYNKAGFFGRVVPIQNMTNSQPLLLNVQSAIKELKQEEHAS